MDGDEGVDSPQAESEHEPEVREAVQRVIDRWRPTLDKLAET